MLRYLGFGYFGWLFVLLEVDGFEFAGGLVLFGFYVGGLIVLRVWRGGLNLYAGVVVLGLVGCWCMVVGELVVCDVCISGVWLVVFVGCLVLDFNVVGMVCLAADCLRFDLVVYDCGG